MEYLNLSQGLRVAMNNIICITYGANVINIIHVNPNTHELGVSEWTTKHAHHFINEVNRLQQIYLDYLNRKGIPYEN